MAGRQRGRGNANGTAGSAVVKEETCARNEAQEDMPMCRHINPVSTTVGCCGMEKQLRELNQVLDYQNKILVELLQTMRGQ